MRRVSTGADKWWLKKCMEVLTFFYFLDEIGSNIISGKSRSVGSWEEKEKV